jgi:hypothetical protein
MGNTSFIVLRTARHDVPEPSRTQFAELTGAYWLEPIYAGLANEWNRQGRTVPGAPREHWRVPPDGSPEAETTGSSDPRGGLESGLESGLKGRTEGRPEVQERAAQPKLREVRDAREVRGLREEARDVRQVPGVRAAPEMTEMTEMTEVTDGRE